MYSVRYLQHSVHVAQVAPVLQTTLVAGYRYNGLLVPWRNINKPLLQIYGRKGAFQPGFCNTPPKLAHALNDIVTAIVREYRYFKIK